MLIKKISIIALVAIMLLSCCKMPKKVIEYVPVKASNDSIEYVATIVNLKYQLRLKEDSIYQYSLQNDSLRLELIYAENRYDELYVNRDSIADENLTAQYKLERIRNYVKIAAKGNNIKYLRGWITRVLND